MPYIDCTTTIETTPPFSILLNPMVTTVSPHKLSVMLYGAIDPYLAPYLIPCPCHYRQLVAWAISNQGYHKAALCRPTQCCQRSLLPSTASPPPPYPHFWVLHGCAAPILALFTHSNEEGSSEAYMHAYAHYCVRHTPRSPSCIYRSISVSIYIFMFI